MSAGRIIAYLAAAVLLFFGVLFIWGAFSPQAAGQGGGWIVVGLVMAAMAFLLIWFASRRKPAEGTTQIIQKIDLSGDVNLEKLTCRNCGGALTAENVKMVAGAPVVSCPYCGTSYQIAEEPKW